MSFLLSQSKLTKGAGLALLASLLSGCAYDHLQHTDRVAYSSGDAVRANLERETLQPTAEYMYDTSGLGQNGNLVGPVDD